MMPYIYRAPRTDCLAISISHSRFRQLPSKHSCLSPFLGAGVGATLQNNPTPSQINQLLVLGRISLARSPVRVSRKGKIMKEVGCLSKLIGQKSLSTPNHTYFSNTQNTGRSQINQLLVLGRISLARSPVRVSRKGKIVGLI
jgi:hypothetical protein